MVRLAASEEYRCDACVLVEAADKGGSEMHDAQTLHHLAGYLFFLELFYLLKQYRNKLPAVINDAQIDLFEHR